MWVMAPVATFVVVSVAIGVMAPVATFVVVSVAIGVMSPVEYAFAMW